jgi:hypothetical protein
LRIPIEKVFWVISAINARAGCHRQGYDVAGGAVSGACHVIHDEEHPARAKAKKRKIEPVAPSHGLNRLTAPDTVEVFLMLNCKLTFNRQCTTLEKGDVLTWIQSIH